MPAPVRARLATVASLGACACFSPTYGTGLTCGPGQECPPDQTCNLAIRRCVAEGTNLTPSPPVLSFSVDQITWNAVPNALRYSLSRSATPGGPYTSLDAALQVTSYLDNQFVDDGTYYYVATVTDANGTSGLSNELAVGQQHTLCASSLGPARVVTFPMFQNGDGSPLFNINGPTAAFGDPYGLAVDFVHDELWVASYAPDQIDVFPRMATGDVPHLRTIRGPSTMLSNSYDVLVDTVHDEVFVTSNSGATVNVYPRTADGDVAPIRQIHASAMISPYALALDLVHDELLVADYTGGNYLVFPRTADGTDVTPLRNVPATAPVGIAVDTVHDEIFVASYNTGVYVFDRLADGPSATSTRSLTTPAYSVRYDALHDTLIVGQSDGIYTFLRTATGSDGAQRQIKGSNTLFGAAYYPTVCY
jgi:hypothetical protein